MSGNARLTSQDLDRLSINSVSGDATVQARLKPDGVFNAETLSGRLTVTLPASTSAKLSIQTFSGDIVSPVGKVDREEYGPGKSLQAQLGQGRGKINVESFSGTVKLVLE